MKKSNPYIDTYRRDAAMQPSDPVKKSVGKVRTFMRMLWDRSYKTSWTTKLTVLGGMAYMLIPADMIPDVIPIVGLVDDVAVFGLIIAQFNQEIARYRHYLASGLRVKPKAVRKSPYKAAIEEVERVAPTPSPVGKTLGTVVAR